MHKIGTLAVAALSISGSLLTGAYVLHLIGIYSLPAENLTGIKEALVFGWLILQGAVGRIVDIEKAQSDT